LVRIGQLILGTMTRRLKSWAFFVALGLSIALLLPLMCGYIGRTGVSVCWGKSGSPAVLQWVILTAEEGRVRLWVESSPPAKASPGTMSPARAVEWYTVWPLRRPDLRRAVWSFDAHPLPARRAFIIAFPSWCAIAICLILPAIWFARRRPSGPERGFAVVRQESARTQV